ncbi:MAG: CaiB/BaiF CoA-transferase family protein, partial [Bacteroidota bacterium]
KREKSMIFIPFRAPASGTLKGIKIIDFSRLLPGPLATLLLAEMGAEVIKVESPSFYDYTRDMPPMQNGESMAYLALNRSKRSLCLDYTQEEGKALVIELLREADILVEQFRPGVMQKMGLDYKTLQKINPRLIYVSITGYGQTGPYAHLAGHDLNYITLAGVLAGNQNEAPQMPLIQMADIAGGSYMAMIAILAALHSREKTGEGQFVDVSMMDGVFPLTINALLNEWAIGKPSSREEKMLSGALLNYNIYPTKDGRYIALGTLEPKFWNRFCTAVQKPNWKSRMFEQDAEKIAHYKSDLETLFKSQDADYWHKFGMEQDLLINVIREVSELEDDPQVKSRSLIQEMEHSKAGKVKSIGQPLKFSKTPAQAFWPAPLLGEDSLALMQEMGVSQTRIQEMIVKGILKCQSPEAK